MDALQTQTVNSTTAPQPNYIPGLIAVVGCDGTGKSTLTTDLVKSLQQHWQTERRYLGLLSGEDGDKIKRLPLVGVWLERRLAAKSSKTQSMKTKSPALWAALIMYCFSLRRMTNLRKVQRLAQSGVLVVSDLNMFLAQRERRLYQQMAQYRPELIIRLGIDIDTAISRKPDHDYAELQDKIGVMSKIGYNGTKILEIDSRAPYSEVLEQAQKAVSLVAIVSDRRSLT
ncbi:hypothetical protein AC26_2921 [Escherichia coli 1-176-05_S3_C2]|uniref:hypothetical protein n=1 Tax=Escherichia TaxID=561 RepID=UPI00045386D8|nr:hypothetical protein AC26_2921 [Escherichia coli 1-176-05_S3_C2]WGM54637.1 hypothetical protein OSH18_16640 [Escherichia ruysiae]HAL9675936.1 hypothetical protein [Escherichia coli]